MLLKSSLALANVPTRVPTLPPDLSVLPAYVPGGFFQPKVAGPIHLTNLDCLGDESSFSECKMSKLTEVRLPSSSC